MEEGTSLGIVLLLPVPPLSCENCVNVLYGRSGLYCRELNEDIWDENEAVTCTLYEAE